MKTQEISNIRQRQVKHIEKKYAQSLDRIPKDPVEPSLFSIFLLIVCFLGLIVCGCVYFSAGSTKSDPFKTGLFSADELSKYGGDNNRTILLSCLGQVFEVTKGRKFYGTNQSYSFFSGRDASRAFISGKFSQEGNQVAVDDVDDLDNEEIFAIVEWRDFYHKEYKHVGKLVGGNFYDSAGAPTAALSKAEEKSALAMKDQQKEKDAEKLHPSCNSRWSQQDGGMVWCNNNLHPRKTFVKQKGSETVFRCACFESESFSERHQLYNECSAAASKCQTSPPPSKLPPSKI